MKKVKKFENKFRDHSFSKSAKYSKKLTFLPPTRQPPPPHPIHSRKCAYKGVSFSEIFAYVLNGPLHMAPETD